MANELSTTDLTTNYPVLDKSSDLSEAIKANSSGTIERSSLTVCGMPSSGATQWSYETAMGEEVTTKAITGIPVLKKRTGVLYPTEGGGFGASPVLRTDDCKTAVRVSDDIGDLSEDLLEDCRIGDKTYDWTKLHYAQFGSAANGYGKRANEYLEIGILQEGEAYPIIVRCSAGSIRIVQTFIELMPVPFYGSIISLGLKRAENKQGNPYSQVKPSLVSTLPKDVRDMIKEMYTIPLGSDGV